MRKVMCCQKPLFGRDYATSDWEQFFSF
jgi:hypothetical protein